MTHTINLVVEDTLSEAVLRRVVLETSRHLVVGAVYPIRKAWNIESGPNGHGYIRKNFPAFNSAAVAIPHLLLVDLDNNACAPTLIRAWTAGHTVNRGLILRVAVREVESWIIGDRDGLADALGLAHHYFPENPERISDPKRYIVHHAMRSRLKTIRNDIAPALGSRGQTGPYYTRFLSNFVRDTWDIDVATRLCESLRRARDAISALKF